jgi:hypothetical protein
MAVHVNEPRGHDTVSRVNDVASRYPIESADGGNSVPSNGNVGTDPGSARPVQKTPSPNYGVKWSLLRHGGGYESNLQKGNQENPSVFHHFLLAD